MALAFWSGLALGLTVLVVLCSYKVSVNSAVCSKGLKNFERHRLVQLLACLHLFLQLLHFLGIFDAAVIIAFLDPVQKLLFDKLLLY